MLQTCIFPDSFPLFLVGAVKGLSAYAFRLKDNVPHIAATHMKTCVPHTTNFYPATVEFLHFKLTYTLTRNDLLQPQAESDLHACICELICVCSCFFVFRFVRKFFSRSLLPLPASVGVSFIKSILTRPCSRTLSLSFALPIQYIFCTFCETFCLPQPTVAFVSVCIVSARACMCVCVQRCDCSRHI